MPDALEDRYEIGERIGAGGISDVFAAVDTRLGRPVAVKFLRTGVGDPRAVARFEREARLAARFNHPNAVAIYDVAERDGQPYLVLELVDGESLSQLLSRRGRLEPGEAVAIAEQVLDALGAAHAQGLVHRDVKPGNVLLTRDHVAKLADFGIAKAVADATKGLTATGELMGTPSYLSPEQVAGHPATAQSDLYAMGIVLYEMLAGSAPFSGETPIATALAHQNAPVPSLAARRPELDPRLVAVVERALEKDPARRFASAGDMRAALAPSRAPIATIATDATIAMQAAAAAPTAAMPVERQRSGARPWIVAAVVVLVIALAVLGIVALTSGGDEPSSSALPPTDAPALAPTTTRPATTTAPPAPTSRPSPTAPPTTVPTTLDGLVAVLTANSAAYGTHGKDLLKDLQSLQRNVSKAPGKKGETSAPKDAEKAINDVTKWIAEGTLDRAFGSPVLSILQQYR